MGMGVPVEIFCLHPFCFSFEMLVGMVWVLILEVMEMLVFVPHLVMAVPVGMVLLKHQNYTSNHQDA